jgi:hypothetical protein
MKHLVIAILLLGTGLVGVPARAQEGPPPEVREVLRLLENPGGRSWLERAADAETGRTSTRPAPRRPTLDQRVEAVSGIRFAFPTVQVAGGEESAPAAARAALDNLRAEAASAA